MRRAVKGFALALAFGLTMTMTLVPQEARAADPAEASRPAVVLSQDPVLAQLLAQAEKHRPEMAREHATLMASRERGAQASSLPDPTLSLGIQNDGFRSIQVGRMETSWLYFVASQTFPWFGKRALRQSLAEEQAKQEGPLVDRTALAIRGEITRAYLDLLLARDELDLIARLEALWLQSEGAARARYETGDGAQSDLMRAQLERSRLALRKIAARAEETRRLELLNSLRGAPAETPLPTTVHLADLADPVVPSVDDAVRDAEGRSPELKRAAQEREVARQAKALAGKEALPDVTLTAGVMPRGGLEPMWQAGVAFTVPVWSLGRQEHAVKERAGLEMRATAAEDSVRRMLAERVRARVRALEATVATNALYRGGLLVQSEATAESSLAQYRVGRVPFTGVLEALASYVNDVGSFLQSVVAAHRLAAGLDEVSLEEAAGPSAGGAGGGMSSGGSTSVAGPGPGAAASSSPVAGASSPARPGMGM